MLSVRENALWNISNMTTWERSSFYCHYTIDWTALKARWRVSPEPLWSHLLWVLLDGGGTRASGPHTDIAHTLNTDLDIKPMTFFCEAMVLTTMTPWHNKHDCGHDTWGALFGKRMEEAVMTTLCDRSCLRLPAVYIRSDLRQRSHKAPGSCPVEENKTNIK